MKPINYMMLIVPVLLMLSCSSKQKLESIAKDYLVEQGNNISSVTVSPGKVEGYYECEASTLGLVENYLVDEIWDISFKDGMVTSAVRRAPTDSTVLTKIENGEQITLRDYFKSVLPDWMQTIYGNDSWEIGKLYSLGDMYIYPDNNKNLLCYNAIIGLRSKKDEIKGYEWKTPTIIAIEDYGLYDYEFEGEQFLVDRSILINPSTGEELTYKQYKDLSK